VVEAGQANGPGQSGPEGCKEEEDEDEDETSSMQQHVSDNGQE
jgi:hypothetical protein